MKTEELKQEAIKKAYGNFYKSNKVNENGWYIATDPKTDKPQQNGFGLSDVYILSNLTWKPKSLLGIETNNSWVRIEEDGSNLPEQGGEYHVIRKEKIDKAIYAKSNRWFMQGNDFPKTTETYGITHYQPIVKPKPPVY